MELSIPQVDFPPGMDPDETEILLGIDAGLDGSYGRTYLVRHLGELKALHRGGMVGAFEIAELEGGTSLRIEAGKWGDEELVLNVHGVGEKRLRVTHHERDATIEVLESLLRTGDPSPELAALLELRLDTTHDDDVREATLTELATLYATSLGDAERAVVHLETLLELRSDHEGALSLLEKLSAGGSVSACEALETSYRELKRYEALADVLLRRAHLEAHDRRAHQTEAARLLADEVGNTSRALEVTLDLLERHPGDAELLARADDLAERSGAWAVAAAGFRAAERATEDPALDAELLWRIGAAHKRAGDIEAAMQAMQELTWLDPKHTDALSELVELFADQERFKSQVEVLERLVELTIDPRRRIDWLLRLAETFETKLADAPSAVATHRRILELDDHHDGALAGLARIYEASEHWQDLVAVLDRRAERAGVKLRAELLAKAATVTEERLGDPEEAIRRWRGALNALPSHVEAMAALTRLLSERGRWLELVNALEQHAIGVDEERAVTALKRAAAICLEHLKQETRAIECYERARELAPTDRDVLRALFEAYAKSTTPGPVVEVITALLELDPDAERARALLVERARRLQQSGDVDGALTDLDAALSRNPPMDERLRLLLEKGEIEAAIDPNVARDTFEAVLEIDPRSRDAFDRIEPLMRAEEDHAALAALYTARAGFVPEEKAQWLCKAARLHATELGDFAAATKLALDAHGDDWQAPEVRQTLGAVGATVGVWREVLDELEVRHKKVPQGERRRHGKAIDAFIEACRQNSELDKDSVMLRAAHHYQHARGAPKRALKLYQRAFRRNREATDIDQRIRELLKRLEQHGELIEHLKEVLDDNIYEGDERRHMLGELADVLEAADRIEEAEAIRRRLAMPTLVTIGILVTVIAIGILVYFLLLAHSS